MLVDKKASRYGFINDEIWSLRLRAEDDEEARGLLLLGTELTEGKMLDWLCLIHASQNKMLTKADKSALKRIFQRQAKVFGEFFVNGTQPKGNSNGN